MPGAHRKAPFYAVQMVAGDLGTKGGLVIDGHARVLHGNGRPIPGLYAAGNNAASVMGNTYPGAPDPGRPRPRPPWPALREVGDSRSSRLAVRPQARSASCRACT
ncbi:MAG: FAD-binding protein [Anaerolineae bacterium]|nr:MAG: FAD-binding protein [Anaerolineae bacterium]